MTSKETVARLLLTILLSKASYPEFFANANTERRESLLDEIEPRLKEVARELSLPYLRPKLVSLGESVLSYSRGRFIRKYRHELICACRSGMEEIIL